MLGFSTPTYVGLDIDPSSLVLASLELINQNWVLNKFAIKEIPVDTIKNGELQKKENFSKALTQLKQMCHLTNQGGAIAVTSKSVTTHYTITNKEENEVKLHYLAESEAKRIFPDIYDHIYLDHCLLRDPEAEKENKQKLLLVAAHKKSVEPVINAAKISGLPIKVIDVDYLCLQRAFTLVEHQAKGSIIGLINLESFSSLFAVIDNNELIHHHHQGFTIQGLDNIIRYTISCFEPNAALEHSKDKKHIEAVKLNPVIENQLINQLQFILKSYTSQPDNTKLEKIILSGRAALIPNIEKMLSEKLMLDIVIAQPFDSIKISSGLSATTIEKLGPACLMACGLAMRNNDNDKY